MKTSRIAILSIPAILISLVLCACGPAKGKDALPAKAEAFAASRTVEVVFVEGEVRIDGAPAEIGARLGTRFVVATGPKSRCDIIFDGRNALGVNQSTIAEFDLSAPEGVVRLHAGGVAAVLKKLARLVDKDSFEIRTAQSVAGVRGTSFCVWADSSSSYVCACNGAVRTIDAKGGHEEVIEAAHHSARLYKASADGSISEETAGLLHHSDVGLESIASRIGYTIDWSKIDR